MPKETVVDRSGMYDVRVGWEAGKDVQVGVDSADGRAIADKLLAGETEEARAVLDKLTGSGALAAFTGLWATLDRAGCNRLIRLLRRARDQAFGRDE